MGGKSSKNKLTKKDVEFLSKHTKYDEATIRQLYKGFRADCPDGKLTPEKFTSLYKAFFTGGNASEFSTHVFRTFDTDGNGYIDFREFMLATTITTVGDPEEKLKWAFRMYDVDSNGSIELSELTKIVQAIYSMLGTDDVSVATAEEQAQKIFNRMDTNHDGSVTMEEFLKGCMEDEVLASILAPKGSMGPP